jgi:hypothetical protein
VYSKYKTATKVNVGFFSKVIYDKSHLYYDDNHLNGTSLNIILLLNNLPTFCVLKFVKHVQLNVKNMLHTMLLVKNVLKLVKNVQLFAKNLQLLQHNFN